MEVYADILVAVNLIVDYFLLRIAGGICGVKCGNIRMVLSAFVGGLSSLYIFLPQSNIMIELGFKFGICVLMSLIAFGYKSMKVFLRNSVILFVTTCGYAGVMIALWYLFKPSGMIINNSVVYFNISPIVLIGTTIVGYILYVVCSALFGKTATASKRCSVLLTADGRNLEVTAIIDTGNSIEDSVGNSDVIIVDEKCVNHLFDTKDKKEERLKLRYRVLPCKTVSGCTLLEGYRCDSAVIQDGDQTIELKKPVIAVSKSSLNDDYSAILNPKIFS